MIKGQFTTNAYDGRHLKLSWQRDTYSLEHNTSHIKWTLTAEGGNATWYYSSKLNLKLNGKTIYSKKDRFKMYHGEISSGSFTIYHKTDGSGSFNMSLDCAIFTNDVNVNGSGSFTLDRIARATTPTFSKTSVYADSSVTISVDAPADFHHVVTYKLGSATGTIANNLKTSVDWTPGMGLCNNMPNSTAEYATVYCKTYSGNTYIGTKSKQIKIMVPNSVVPKVNSITHSEAVNKVKTKIGQYVQYESALNITVNAEGARGSTIKKIETTVNGHTYTGKTFQTGKLQYWNKLVIVTNITDSRGRTDRKETTFDVLKYRKPRVNYIEAERCNADGTVNDNGDCLKIRVKGSVSDLNGRNTRNLKLYYKKSTATAETELSLPTSAWDFVTERIITNTVPDESYSFRAVLTDQLHSVTELSQTGKIVISRHAGGDGVTFLGEATKAGIWDAKSDTRFPPELFYGDVQTAVLPASGTTYTKLADIDVRPGVYLVSASARFSEAIDVSRAFKITAENYEVAVHASDMGFGGVSLTGIIAITTNGKVSFLGRQTSQTQRKLENIKLRAFKLG